MPTDALPVKGARGNMFPEIVMLKGAADLSVKLKQASTVP
jgi:hypothetical protein